METSESTANSPNTDRLIMAGLVAVCLLIYGQVLRFEFINFDDNLYVFENPFVTAGINLASLKWAFTSFHSANWHPLTWISHMLDASLFGPNAGAHHFVNVIFHAANSVLSFVVFKRFTGDVWKSAILAFLFAVHPAHVESVAWISERKDVLSTMFWLLTMLFYFRFVSEAKSDYTFSQRLFSTPYILMVVCFILGLLSKPMLVTLPFALLLLDYWPLQRLKNARDLGPLIVEKLPLILLSAGSAYVTILAQSAYGAIQTAQALPLDTRLVNAVVSYANYIVMFFYPANLGIGYAYRTQLPAWQVISSIVLILAITTLCVWQRSERKYLMVGWLWFLGTMVPVIGLVQVGAQAMADRYTYVPYFGLIVMVLWGLAELLPKLKFNFATTAVAAAIPILALSVTAFNQTSHWKDSFSLYAHTIAVGQGNYITFQSYCSALFGANRLDEAETQCRNSINADSRFADAHVLLGVINVRKGKNEEAVANFNRAIAIDPDNVMAYGNSAAPLGMLGKTDEAEQRLKVAVDIFRRRGLGPAGLANSYSNLAAVFAKQNRFDKAERSLQQALEFAPDWADARANYAFALYLQDKLPEARIEIERAIKLNPNQAEFSNIFGMILMKQGDRKAAVAQFERSLQIKPDFQQAKDNLEKAKATNGRN